MNRMRLPKTIKQVQRIHDSPPKLAREESLKLVPCSNSSCSNQFAISLFRPHSALGFEDRRYWSRTLPDGVTEKDRALNLNKTLDVFALDPSADQCVWQSYLICSKCGYRIGVSFENYFDCSDEHLTEKEAVFEAIPLKCAVNEGQRSKKVDSKSMKQTVEQVMGQFPKLITNELPEWSTEHHRSETARLPEYAKKLVEEKKVLLFALAMKEQVWRESEVLSARLAKVADFLSPPSGVIATTDARREHEKDLRDTKSELYQKFKTELADIPFNEDPREGVDLLSMLIDKAENQQKSQFPKWMPAKDPLPKELYAILATRNAISHTRDETGRTRRFLLRLVGQCYGGNVKNAGLFLQKCIDKGFDPMKLSTTTVKEDRTAHSLQKAQVQGSAIPKTKCSEPQSSFQKDTVNWDEQKLIEGIVRSMNISSINENRVVDSSLQDWITKFGELILQKVQGDGSCQFRALSVVLFDDEEKYGAIRKQVSHYMRENPEIFGETAYVDVTPGRIYANLIEFCTSIESGNEWGNHDTLRAFADLYSVCIQVISSGINGQGALFPLIEPRNQSQNARDRTIFLAHYSEFHYAVIHPKPSAAETPSRGLESSSIEILSSQDEDICAGKETHPLFIHIPSEACGRVIGKGGHMIRSFQMYPGIIKVELTAVNENPNQGSTLQIIGSVNSVKVVEERINEILADVKRKFSNKTRQLHSYQARRTQFVAVPSEVHHLGSTTKREKKARMIVMRDLKLKEGLGKNPKPRKNKFYRD